MSARILLVTLVLFASGCMHYYSRSPGFAPVSPRLVETHGVIYVYRAKDSRGASQQIHVRLTSEQRCTLFAGSYCALVVEPGTNVIGASIDEWNQSIVAGGLGFAAVLSSSHAETHGTSLPVTVAARDATYVEVSFDGWHEAPTATLVTAEEGAAGLRRLHLAVGGRARLPAEPTAQP